MGCETEEALRESCAPLKLKRADYMSDVIKSIPKSIEDAHESYITQTLDTDPAETQEWLESLEYIMSTKGEDRAKYLLSVLEARARVEGVDLPIKSNTAYINTIAKHEQPAFPGNRGARQAVHPGARGRHETAVRALAAPARRQGCGLSCGPVTAASLPADSPPAQWEIR